MSPLTPSLLALALAGSILAGCGEGSHEGVPRCVPGRVESCICGTGGSGTQLCGEDGRFGECGCAGTDAARPDAGMAMDAAPDIDAGVDAGLRDASVMDALPSDAGPPAGHAVLLGFFYQNASTEADAVLARAVLLSERSGPIDVLEYTEYLGFPTIPERIHPLIDAAATAVARSVTFTSFDNHARLGSLLPFADALLVYDVTSAPTAMTIDVIAGAWRDDLIAFLADGGVVIVMDFSGTYDKRTYRVLEGPELMRFGGATRVDGVPLEPTADPLAAGLAPFPAPNQTTIYPLSGGGSAVIQRRDSLEPVVRHLIR